MNDLELCFYLVLFVSPMVYQRGLFSLWPAHFKITWLRERSGLQIHHAHWGLIWIAISGAFSALWVCEAYRPNKAVVLVPMTIGWGLVLDEIIPHLRMPSNDRKRELQVYAESESASIKLIAIVAFVIWLIAQTTK